MIKIENKLPDQLDIRFYRLSGVENNANYHAITKALDQLESEVRKKYSVLMDARSLLVEARTLYKSLGIDPSRYRPASEALLRRLINGKGLYRVNPIVDWGNYCSLTFMVPVGLYDASRISGNITARLGRSGEAYEGLGKPKVELDGKLILEDAIGPFGNPSSDSRRTCVTDKTSDVIFIYYLPAETSQKRKDELDAGTKQLFRQFWPEGCFEIV